MQVDDFIVPPLAWDAIETLTVRIRAQFDLSNNPHFPIIELIEQVLDQKLGWVNFEVGSVEEMGRAEGYTCPKGEFIQLREDVYVDACRNQGRARFTAAHELGHFAMHTNIPLARATRGDGTPAFRLAEPQANQFAAELLMPVAFIRRYDTASTLVGRFGVSHVAACNRLEYLSKKGKI